MVQINNLRLLHGLNILLLFSAQTAHQSVVDLQHTLQLGPVFEASQLFFLLSQHLGDTKKGLHRVLLRHP